MPNHWSDVPSNIVLHLLSMVPYKDSYESAVVSFDLAIQQKGNNSRRSPKGTRMSVR